MHGEALFVVFNIADGYSCNVENTLRFELDLESVHWVARYWLEQSPLWLDHLHFSKAFRFNFVSCVRENDATVLGAHDQVYSLLVTWTEEEGDFPETLNPLSRYPSVESSEGPNYSQIGLPSLSKRRMRSPDLGVFV